MITTNTAVITFARHKCPFSPAHSQDHRLAQLPSKITTPPASCGQAPSLPRHWQLEGTRRLLYIFSPALLTSLYLGAASAEHIPTPQVPVSNTNGVVPSHSPLTLAAPAWWLSHSRVPLLENTLGDWRHMGKEMKNFRLL